MVQFFPNKTKSPEKDVERIYDKVEALGTFCYQTDQEAKIETVRRTIGKLNYESSRTFHRQTALRDLERFFLQMELKALELGKEAIVQYLSQVDEMSMATNTRNNEYYFGCYKDVSDLWDWELHEVKLELLTRENLDLAHTFLINYERLHPNFTYYEKIAVGIEQGLIPEPKEPKLPKRLLHNPAQIREQMFEEIKNIPQTLIDEYLASRKKTGYASIDKVKGNFTLKKLNRKKFQQLFCDLIKAHGRDHDSKVLMDSEFRKKVEDKFSDFLRNTTNLETVGSWIDAEFETQLIEVLASDHLTEMNWYCYHADIVWKLIRPISQLFSEDFLSNLLTALESIDEFTTTRQYHKNQYLLVQLGRSTQLPEFEDTHKAAANDLFALIVQNYLGDMEPFFASQNGSEYLETLARNYHKTFRFDGEKWLFDVPDDYASPRKPRLPYKALYKAFEVETRAKEFCNLLVANIVYNSIKVKTDRSIEINNPMLIKSFVATHTYKVPWAVIKQLDGFKTGYTELDAFVNEMYQTKNIPDLNSSYATQIYRQATRIWCMKVSQVVPIFTSVTFSSN